MLFPTADYQLEIDAYEVGLVMFSHRARRGPERGNMIHSIYLEITPEAPFCYWVTRKGTLFAVPLSSDFVDYTRYPHI